MKIGDLVYIKVPGGKEGPYKAVKGGYLQRPSIRTIHPTRTVRSASNPRLKIPMEIDIEFNKFKLICGETVKK
jgi:hypothetical protein